METFSPGNPENVTTLDENLVRASESLSLAGEYDKAEEIFQLAIEKATSKSWAEVKEKADFLRQELIQKAAELEEDKNELSDYEAVLLHEESDPTVPAEQSEMAEMEPEKHLESTAIEKAGEDKLLPAETSSMVALVIEAERLAERESNLISTLKEIDPEAAELAIRDSLPGIEKVLGEGAILPEKFTPAELKKLSDDVQMYAENPGKRMSVILDYLHAITTMPEFKKNLSDNEQARLRAAMKKYGNLSDADIEDGDVEFYRGVEERLISVIRAKTSKRMDDYTDPFLGSSFFRGYKTSNFFTEVSILREIVPEANVHPAIVESVAVEVLQRTDLMAIKVGKDKMAEYRVKGARDFLRSIENDHRTKRRGGLTIKQAEAASRCIFEILSLIPDLYEQTEPVKEPVALEE